MRARNPGGLELRYGERHPKLRRQAGLRVAPARDGRLAASIWRVWAQGDEVYLASRSVARISKVSLHRTGAWFLDAGHERHQFARPIPLCDGRWLHALELKWLLDKMPPVEVDEPPLKPKDAAVLLETPPGFACIVNVLFGAGSTTVDSALPTEMQGVRLQEVTLRSGTPLVVIGRVQAFSDQDRRALHEHRYELAPKVSFDGPRPSRARAELMRAIASPIGGNVILVIPLGHEAISAAE